MARETLSLNRDRPDFENGAVGTQNDARLALFNQIADQTEAIRAEDFEDVTDDMYLNPAGTGGEGDESEGDRGNLQDSEEYSGSSEDSGEDATDVSIGTVESSIPKLKVLGEEIEITPEAIARWQKIASGEKYLEEASKLYKSASTINEPSQDVQTVDDAALARAIQMGTEEEAIAAIQQLRQQSLPAGEIEAIIERKLANRDTKTDAERFKESYRDLLADPRAQEAVWAFDTLYANDNEPPTFARFEKAAKKVMELRGHTGLEDKQKRKDNAPRPVVGQGARPPAKPEEREPTQREIIAEMARSRGQMQYGAGN